MPQPREFVSAFYVKVNGQNLTEQQINKIGNLIVEQNVHLPSACTKRVHAWPSPGGMRKHWRRRQKGSATVC